MRFKEFVFGSPLDTILKEVEEYGKRISLLTNPAIYENECKAKHYQQNLEATRKAYKKLKEGEDPYSTLKNLWYYVKDDEVKKIWDKTRRSNNAK